MKNRQRGLFAINYAALIVVIGFVTLFSTQTSAQTPEAGEPQFDVFQLSAEAQADVDNDLMNVQLVAQATHPNAAELANKINAAMGWAMVQLQPFAKIETQTLNYQTYPQYEKNRTKIKGWVATQTLQLETDDFESAGKAIQILQEKLQVQSMVLKAKPETRQTAEDELINKALNAFKRRAELVQTNMGAPGYRVKNLSINTQGSGHQPRYQDHYRGATEGMAVASAPAIEAGTSSVTVRVNGQIQLQ